MTGLIEKMRRASPAQADVAAAAARDGEFRSSNGAVTNICRKLNAKGLLRRDPKDGARWYATEELFKLVDANPALVQPEPAAAPADPVLAKQHDDSELVAIVEHARALLDDGDVQTAFKLSSVAYDQAKAVASTAERVKASRDLVEKARRLQADALKIESMCYVKMADAVDEAQAKGQISRGGRPTETVHDADRFTLEQVGIDKRRLSEARQLRNAVRKEPEFIDRVIQARLSEGLEPSRASLKGAAGHAVGTKTATKAERGDDLYETPIEAMRTLLALESFSGTVLEPSVGKGAILRPLEDAGYDVLISDVVDRGITTCHGELQGVGDFLDLGGLGNDIVTNPPYGIANAYAAHALREHQPDKMALLLNLNFLAGFDDPDRRYVMDEHPPSRIYVFTRRLPMMHRDGWAGKEASSQMNTAWFVWERNPDGSYGNGYPQLIRVDWKAFEDAEPLEPGEMTHRAPLEFVAAEEDLERQTPRKTVDERVEEEQARALIWIGEAERFSAVSLRQGIAVRPSVADALIADFLQRELIMGVEGEDYVVTHDYWQLVEQVAARIAVSDMEAA